MTKLTYAFVAVTLKAKVVRKKNSLNYSMKEAMQIRYTWDE